MRILDKRVYVGPNLYANFKVIRFTLDLGPLEDHPSATVPGFVDGLLRAVPSLDQHGCSYGEPGGFVRRLSEDGGTWMGHVLEHVAIELQNLAGARVTFGKTRGSGSPGCYHVVYEYEDPWVGEEAGRLALRLLHSLVPPALRGDAEPDPEFDFAAGLTRLIRGAEKRAFGPSTASLVRAAEARDIPWVRLSEGSLVQFGHGHRQRRIQATVTSETRHIAVEIASDKELTNRILGDLGLPVPKQDQVYEAEDAVEAAERLGYPVVVKPLDANHGRGVSIGLQRAEEVRTAFAVAAEHSDCVLVETFIEGLDHRMLVVNGELVAVAKRVPGHVVGDGVRSVRGLVDVVNPDPRRGIGHEKVLTRIELDEQAERLLAKRGYTAESVPPAGEVVYLRSTANLSTGGTAIDVTDVCHPDNREMAIRAAAAVGLDVCGVDFLSPDITRSWKEVGGGICELNAAPGFRMHVAPSEGQPRDVAGRVLDMLFPPGSPSRIPIAAITGTNGKTTTTRMLAHIHKLTGATVGMTTTDGVYLDGRLTVAGDMTGPVAARMVLTEATPTQSGSERSRITTSTSTVASFCRAVAMVVATTTEIGARTAGGCSIDSISQARSASPGLSSTSSRTRAGARTEVIRGSGAGGCGGCGACRRPAGQAPPCRPGSRTPWPCRGRHRRPRLWPPRAARRRHAGSAWRSGNARNARAGARCGAPIAPPRCRPAWAC